MSSTEPGQNAGQGDGVEKLEAKRVELNSTLPLTLPLTLPIRKTLPNGAIAELDTLRSEETEAVRALLNYFVTSSGTEGLTYPFAQPLSPSEFAAYWLSRDAFVVRAVGDAPPPASQNTASKEMSAREISQGISQEMRLRDPSPQNISLTTPPDKTSPDVSPNRASPAAPALGEVLGAFYLKPNFPGWCSHICNAGFIVQPAMRGQGIGRWMAETMLAIAPTKGYTAVMFNLVFATNEPSLNLWRSLGFSTIGRIPHAARLSEEASVDAIMLYRTL